MHREVTTIGKGGELGNLPLTGLKGGGDPREGRGFLLQLNLLGFAAGNGSGIEISLRLTEPESRLLQNSHSVKRAPSMQGYSVVR